MSKENSQATATNKWTPTQAYIMAVICLAIGVAAGYFARSSAAPTAGGAAAQAQMSAMAAPQAQITREQYKQTVDNQAEPLLAQLKSNPNDAALLAKVGDLYYDAKLYPEAIGYYAQSLQVNPANANVRTDMGTAYFYSGDADRAIREFETALKSDPKHAQTLMNMGVVKFEGKMDINGAIQAWETLLKIAPDYPERAQVQQMIAQAKAHANVKPGQKTSKPASM